MKTKWSLNELARYADEALILSDEIDVEEELKKRNPQVLSITPVFCEGALTVDGQEYILYLELSYTVVLPSSRSLEPTEIPMHVSISEIYLPPDAEADPDLDEQDVLVIELEYDWIDLKEIVTDNILASLPSKVLTEEEKKSAEMPHGKGWQVVSEDEAKTKARNGEPEGDPRFAALKSLFQDETDSQEE